MKLRPINLRVKKPRIETVGTRKKYLVQVTETDTYTSGRAKGRVERWKHAPFVPAYFMDLGIGMGVCACDGHLNNYPLKGKNSTFSGSEGDGTIHYSIEVWELVN